MVRRLQELVAANLSAEVNGRLAFSMIQNVNFQRDGITLSCEVRGKKVQFCFSPLAKQYRQVPINSDGIQIGDLVWTRRVLRVSPEKNVWTDHMHAVSSPSYGTWVAQGEVPQPVVIFISLFSFISSLL